MRKPLTLLAALSIIVITTACASTGGSAASSSASCELQPKDSVFALHAPVFRECAVTTKVRMISTDVHPDFTPQRGTSCFSAEYEFVVTADGRVDVGTARLVKTNNQQFAEALRSMLGRLKYEPATREGTPVAQITSLKQEGQVVAVMVPAGVPPSSVRPPRPGPGC